MNDDLAHALAITGDRWTIHVISELLGGTRRFGELADALPGIAPNVLTARLRHLEREGLISATPYSRRPLRLGYDLTESGRELSGAISLLTAWGARQSNDSAGIRHDVCGTPLEARLFCSTCEQPVDDAAAEPLRWL